MDKGFGMDRRKDSSTFRKVVWLICVFIATNGMNSANAFSLDNLLDNLVDSVLGEDVEYLKSWKYILELEQAWLETEDDTNFIYQEFELKKLYFMYPEDWLVHAEMSSVLRRLWGEAEETRLKNNDPDAELEYRTIVFHNNATFEFFPLVQLLGQKPSEWYSYDNDQLNGYFTYLAASIMSAYTNPVMEDDLTARLEGSVYADMDRSAVIELIEERVNVGLSYAVDILGDSVLAVYPMARLESD